MKNIAAFTIALCFLVSFPAYGRAQKIKQGGNEQVQRFLRRSKRTEKEIQLWSARSKIHCVQVVFTDSEQPNKSNQLNQFIRKLKLLQTIWTYTDDKLILTPKIHQRMQRDIHKGNRLAKLLLDENSAVEHKVKYTLRTKECNQDLSIELNNILLRIYGSFRKYISSLRSNEV